MKKNSIYIIVLFIVIFFFNLISAEHKQEKGYVVFVYDGDTIKLSNGDKLRLIGIDTPEMNYNKNYQPEFYAKNAFEYLKSRILYREISYEYDIKIYDNYNRKLVYLFDKNNKLINSDLLEKGFGTLFLIPPNVKYKNKLIKAYRSALNKNVGIWGHLNTLYWNQSQKITNVEKVNFENRLHKKSLIKGTIVKSYRNENIIILKFQSKKEINFQGVIFKPDYFRFPFSPDKYFLNKEVVLSGKITEYEGTYQIIIETPVQLKIVN